jgi:uncharacterized Tic20 family protein
MGPTTGRSGQAPARRQRQYAAGHRAARSVLAVPTQRGPAWEAMDTGRDRGGPVRAGVPARIAAVSGYLLAALASFIPPAMVCLLSRRDAVFVRTHAIQAMNAAFTTLLYALSSAILAAILALDSLRLGLEVGASAALLCWLVTLGYLIAAAGSAARGRFYQIPRCLCADLLRPEIHASQSGRG